MKINSETFSKTKRFVDEISSKHSYPENIRHLLYIVVPAFIEKYGLNEDKNIFSVFEKVPIRIDEKANTLVVAYFARRLYYNGLSYETDKEIVLQRYSSIEVVELLDSLIHEYNHALNSLRNEIKEDGKRVMMRTGISYIIYDRSDSTKVLESDTNRTLEELVNTRQTESIIEIIKSFATIEIADEEIMNSLHYVERQIGSGYESQAYLLQSSVCKPLIDNRSFLPTLERLRYDGYVDDIPSWFDEITGEKGSFDKLSKILDKSLKLEHEFYKAKFFKARKISKIRSLISQVTDIINLYDSNSIYK